MITKIQNIFNLEEEIDINWNSQQEKFQKFNSKFQLPRFIYSKIGITSELDIYKKHKEFINIQTSFSTEYPITSYSKIKLLYQRKISNTEQNSLQNSKIKSLGLGVDFNINNLTINSENYIGNKKYPDKTNRHINIVFCSEYFYKIFNNTTFTFTNNTQLIFAQNYRKTKNFSLVEAIH